MHGHGANWSPRQRVQSQTALKSSPLFRSHWLDVDVTSTTNARVMCVTLVFTVMVVLICVWHKHVTVARDMVLRVAAQRPSCCHSS